LDEDVDRVAVLGVHHHERARVRGGLHDAEERLVVDHDRALVGHEELVARDALVGHARQLLKRPSLLEVGDRQVEADVDDRLRGLDLPVPGLERLGERLALGLDAEVDVTGRRRTRRDRAGGSRRTRSCPEGHVQVRVRSMQPKHHFRPASITLSA
jgi:hypothetical protein